MSKLIIDDSDAFAEYLASQLEGIAVEDIQTAIQNYKTKKDSISIILNYSPKTHAISGNTKTIKDKLMALNEGGKKLVSYNASLAFGPGWIIMDKDRLSEVTDMFDENEIEYTQVEKGNSNTSAKTSKPAPKSNKTTEKAKKSAKKESDDGDEIDYSSLTILQLKSLLKDKELPVTGKKDELVDRLIEADAKPIKKTASKTPTKTAPKKAVPKTTAKTTTKKTAAKDSIKDKAPPKSKSSAPKTLKATKNDFGNHEETDTGIVFEKLPVGANGNIVSVAIGIQNPDSDETGIDSVNPLDEDMIKECEDKSWRYLTDDMIKLVKKRDEELYEKLVALQGRADPEADVEDDE
jgi:hypothetical protein